MARPVKRPRRLMLYLSDALYSDIVRAAAALEMPLSTFCTAAIAVRLLDDQRLVKAGRKFGRRPEKALETGLQTNV